MSSMNSGGTKTTSLVASDSLSMGINLQLLIQKLNGKNYIKWARSVKLALEGKEKLDYLPGEEEILSLYYFINNKDTYIGKAA